MEFMGAARMFLTFGFYKAGHDGVILAYGGGRKRGDGDRGNKRPRPAAYYSAPCTFINQG